MAPNVLIIRTLEDFRELIKSSINETNNVSKELMQKSVNAFLEQTGLIDKAVDKLKDELLCAVCRSIPLETSLTKCHHIFCEYCLNSCQRGSEWHCPMCRTDLTKPVYTNQKRLYQTDTLIEVVMSKNNFQYISWKEQQRFERTWEQNTRYLQYLFDKMVEFIGKLETEYGVKEHGQELGNLAQEFLLSTGLSCSKANHELRITRTHELSKSAMHTVIQVLHSLPVVDIDGSHLLNLLSDCLYKD